VLDGARLCSIDLHDGLSAVAFDLFGGSGQHQSIVARAEALDVDRYQLCNDTRLLGAALLLSDLMARKSLEERIASLQSDKYELDFYAEYDRYDESTMPVTVSKPSEADDLARDSGMEVACPQAVLVKALSTGRRSLKDSGRAKIVQASVGFGMVVRKLATHAGGGDQYFSIVGDTITSLQTCDRTTAEVLKHLALSRSGASLGAKRFKVKARVVSIDHYAANLKAERSIKADLEWLSLVIRCEAHSVSTIHTRVMDLFTFDVSGALHVSLAVELAGMMDKFRASLRAVIIERLVWPPLRGRPSADAERHRLRCIHALTVGFSKASKLQQQALLRSMPLGDWRKRDVVEVYLTGLVGELPSKAVLAKEVAHSLVQGISWHKFAKYPRNRWLGGEAAISQPTLIDACHGLLRPTFEHFCRSVGKRAMITAAFCYHSKAVLPKLGRLISLILISSTGRYVCIGSPEYERHEAAREAKATEEGDGHGHVARSYPLTIAAECSLEGGALVGIRGLLHQPSLWSLIPETDFRAKFVGSAFRARSRAGGLVHARLQFIHDRFPFRLFLLVKNPDLANSTQREAACSRDSFTQDFCQKYSLDDPCARYVLLLLAQMVRITIADIECRHASLRRLLVRIQAKFIELESLASRWVAQRYRRRAADNRHTGSPFSSDFLRRASAEHASDPDLSCELGRAGKVRAPGLWRVFVALETAGRKGQGRPDFRELAARCHSMSAEELGYCRRVSESTAASRKQSGKSSSIAPRVSEVEVATRAAQDQALSRRMRVSMDSEERPFLSDDVFTMNLSLDDVMRLARAHCVAFEKDRARLEELETSALQAYHARFTDAEREALMSPSLSSSTRFGSMFRRQSMVMQTFRFEPDVSTVAHQLVAFAKKHVGSTNFGRALSDWWVGKHAAVLHDTCPVITNAADSSSQCWKA
ncbi:unnamed protein product, partial [Prorocentrum cordatum]